MKVGIFTFHSADNYGAVLQAYGLANVCERLGYEAHIVDYRPDYITEQYRYFHLTGSVSSNIIKMANCVGNIRKKNGFERFRRDFIKTVPYRAAGFDAALYGSDQIWNPNIKAGFDPVYFGENEFGASRNVSYAASVGKAELSSEEKVRFQTLISHLDSFSVRESSTADMLSGLLDRPVQCVLDPTLLVEAKDWDKLTNPVPHLHQKYIFIYDANKNLVTLETARRLSAQTGLPIIELTYNKTKLFTGTRQINYAAPGQFIHLIKNASFVVTSSFHGTAFSVIYRKNFYTVLHKAYGNRMYDLLSALGLLDRIVSGKEVDAVPPDYAASAPKLNVLREDSIKFIRNSLTKQE